MRGDGRGLVALAGGLSLGWTWCCVSCIACVRSCVRAWACVRIYRIFWCCTGPCHVRGCEGCLCGLGWARLGGTGRYWAGRASAAAQPRDHLCTSPAKQRRRSSPVLPSRPAVVSPSSCICIARLGLVLVRAAHCTIRGIHDPAGPGQGVIHTFSGRLDFTGAGLCGGYAWVHV